MGDSDRIEVDLQRSGGLAGQTWRSDVDSAQLPQADAQRLRELVDAVDLASPQAPPSGADRFQYDIHVRRGGASQNLTAYDGSMSPELKALVDWLVARGLGPKKLS